MARPAAVKDYRALARRRLPRLVFDYLEGAAEDGQGLERNRGAYGRVRFAPRMLRDVTEVDSSTSLFGQTLGAPMLVGPTGLNGLYYPQADELLARAAHQAGLPFVLSTASTSLLERVRECSDGALWLQLYVQRDLRIAQDVMRRASAAGYSTLMLTVDTTVHGKRDHDIRNGFQLPLRITPRLAADMLMHPAWCLRMLKQGGPPQLVNLARSAGITSGLAGQADTMSRQMHMSLDWDCIGWLREHWPGKILIKGLLTVADALQARAHGFDGIVLSNHGGRQLGCVASPLQVLPDVVQALGDSMPVLIDGGIQRGADVAKACALGASAVLLGRAPLYGLASHGMKGASEVLALLRHEFDTVLRLIGQPRARSLDASCLEEGWQERLPSF